MARILLLDDEKVARSVYGDFLTAAGHEVMAFSSLHDAKLALAEQRFDAVVTDLILPEGDGMEVLEHTRETHPGTEVIVVCDGCTDVCHDVLEAPAPLHTGLRLPTQGFSSGRADARRYSGRLHDGGADGVAA